MGGRHMWYTAQSVSTRVAQSMSSHIVLVRSSSTVVRSTAWKKTLSRPMSVSEHRSFCRISKSLGIAFKTSSDCSGMNRLRRRRSSTSSSRVSSRPRWGTSAMRSESSASSSTACSTALVMGRASPGADGACGGAVAMVSSILSAHTQRDVARQMDARLYGRARWLRRCVQTLAGRGRDLPPMRREFSLFTMSDSRPYGRPASSNLSICN